jgi:hypothetical protein
MAQCGAYCGNLRALGCSAALPSPGGVTCEATCARAMAYPDLAPDVGCVVQATSRESLARCGERCSK